MVSDLDEIASGLLIPDSRNQEYSSLGMNRYVLLTCTLKSMTESLLSYSPNIHGTNIGFCMVSQGASGGAHAVRTKANLNHHRRPLQASERDQALWEQGRRFCPPGSTYLCARAGSFNTTFRLLCNTTLDYTGVPCLLPHRIIVAL